MSEEPAVLCDPASVSRCMNNGEWLCDPSECLPEPETKNAKKVFAKFCAMKVFYLLHESLLSDNSGGILNTSMKALDDRVGGAVKPVVDLVQAPAKSEVEKEGTEGVVKTSVVLVHTSNLFKDEKEVSKSPEIGVVKSNVDLVQTLSVQTHFGRSIEIQIVKSCEDLVQIGVFSAAVPEEKPEAPDEAVVKSSADLVQTANSEVTDPATECVGTHRNVLATVADSKFEENHRERKMRTEEGREETDRRRTWSHQQSEINRERESERRQTGREEADRRRTRSHQQSETDRERELERNPFPTIKPIDVPAAEWIDPAEQGFNVYEETQVECKLDRSDAENKSIDHIGRETMFSDAEPVTEVSGSASSEWVHTIVQADQADSNDTENLVISEIHTESTCVQEHTMQTDPEIKGDLMVVPTSPQVDFRELLQALVVLMMIAVPEMLALLLSELMNFLAVSMFPEQVSMGGADPAHAALVQRQGGGDGDTDSEGESDVDHEVEIEDELLLMVEPEFAIFAPVEVNTSFPVTEVRDEWSSTGDKIAPARKLFDPGGGCA